MLQRAEELHGVELLLVGGGNTFQLLRECRSRGFLEPLKREISLGCKYVGWSAGSNLACPSIKTTNDMPIVDPGGLEALGLPEGDWLRVSGGRTELRGPHDAVWFCAEKRLSVKPGSLEAA